ATPFVRLEGLLSHGREVAPVGVLGIDVDARVEIETLSLFLAEDSLKQLADNSRALIVGRTLAEALDVDVGERLTLVIPRRSDNRGAPDLAIFEVVDIFNSGTEIDNNLAITSF